MPASSRASSSTRPAGPTNGRPALSSWSPGCSPTSITSAWRDPSPKTVWVPVFQRSQAWQPAAAFRRVSRSRWDGTGAPSSNSWLTSRSGGGILDRVVTVEHTLEPGDLQHLAHRPLVLADDPQLARAAAGQLEAGDERPQTGGVEEVDAL